jgi:hypothetical protein
MKNMLLISADWNEQPSFKLIPTTKDCPYVEAIYDSRMGILAIIGSTKKEVFHMLPKLDDNGDVMDKKIKRAGSKPYKEERRTIETFQEYYIEKSAEIESFINMFAINADTFDFGSVMNTEKNSALAEAAV